MDYRPGPGAYYSKIGIADKGYQYVSTVKSPKTRTFYHSDRRTIDIPKESKCNFYLYLIIILDLPGPGNYKLHSDFGNLESGRKYSS